ncbi:MAG: branched-chain amino acid transport system substrate-binding protein [Desulforhopalus sp.]|jgi:branched-chain amino acid transport system substrate-binding protein
MKTYTLLSIIFVIFVVIPGCEKAKRGPVTGKSVKIGVIGPMTGSDKAWGEKGLYGVKTALKLQPFLDNGSLVEIVVEDDRNQPELARKALLKLVEDDTISSVIIMSASEVVLSLVEMADTLAIPIFAVMSTHPDITKNSSFISQLLFDDHFQASVAALYVRDELLAERVGVIIDEKNPHSEYLARQFDAKFTSTGGICQKLPLNNDPKKLLAGLEFLQHKKIKFLYVPLDAEHVISIAQILQQIDYHPLLVGSDGLQATLLLQHSDNLDLVNGMLATDPYSYTIPPTGYGKTIIRNYQKLFNTPGTGLAVQGAEGTSIMLSAMNRCNKQNDRSCINRMLRSTRDFEGMFGKISIDADGKAERPILINTINNGRLIGVVKVY